MSAKKGRRGKGVSFLISFPTPFRFFRKPRLVNRAYILPCVENLLCAVAIFDFKAEGDWGEQAPVRLRPYPFTLPPANHHEPQSERKLVPAYPFRTTAPVRYLTVALRLLLMLSKA